MTIGFEASRQQPNEADHCWRAHKASDERTLPCHCVSTSGPVSPAPTIAGNFTTDRRWRSAKLNRYRAERQPGVESARYLLAICHCQQSPASAAFHWRNAAFGAQHSKDRAGMLKPGAGQGLQLAKLGLLAEASREDVHKMVVAISLPGEDEPKGGGKRESETKSSAEERVLQELDRQELRAFRTNLQNSDERLDDISE